MIKSYLILCFFIVSALTGCNKKESITDDNNLQKLSKIEFAYDFLSKRTPLYKENYSAEYILSDLSSNKIISASTKEKILKNLEGKSENDFINEAKLRAINRSKFKNSKKLMGSTGPENSNSQEAMISQELAVEVFDNMALMLSAKGVNWGCISAITSYGLSIAGIIAFPPAGAAAAALWGAGHILTGLSLSSCASSEAMKEVIMDIQRMDQEEFISEYVELLPVPELIINN